jgi:putative ABC transport system permease protein
VLDENDRWDRPIAVVVDTTLARKAWPGRDAVGQPVCVQLFRNGVFGPHWGEVVGVVEPVRLTSLRVIEREQIYIAHHQSPQRTMYPALKVAGDPLAVVPLVQQAVGNLEKDLPVFDVRLAAGHVSDAMAHTRAATIGLTIFSGTALLLAAAGLYAAMAFSVARRRREIGIRIAIGASPRAVLGMVVRQGLTLTGIGVAMGLGGAVALSRALAGLLFGVTATDPATFASVAAGLAAVAAGACWLPARRAARVDPVETLRSS